MPEGSNYQKKTDIKKTDNVRKTSLTGWTLSWIFRIRWFLKMCSLAESILSISSNPSQG